MVNLQMAAKLFAGHKHGSFLWHMVVITYHMLAFETDCVLTMSTVSCAICVLLYHVVFDEWGCDV